MQLVSGKMAGAGEGRYPSLPPHTVVPVEDISVSAHPTSPIGVSEVWASAELLEATRNGVAIWLPVTGTEGRYEVSNFGEARSWAGPRGVRRAEPLTLAACDNGDGYGCVTIFYADGRKRYVPVHVLVCEAFIGPRPGPAPYWQGGHKNDIKTDNRLTNVRWCTNALNITERWENGKSGRSAREAREVNGAKHYRCTGCDTWKPEADFGRISKTLAARSRCGIQSRCRLCATADRRKYKRTRKAAAS